MAAARLPLPGLSRGRFAYATQATQPCSQAAASDGSLAQAGAAPDTGADTGRIDGAVGAYTDQALLRECGVLVAFTERSGGVSLPPYSSLNLGSADALEDAQCVKVNRVVLDCALRGPGGIAPVTACQVHGEAIVEVLSDDKATIEAARAQAQAGCDALLVDCAGVPALMRFADCLPLVLVAPSGAFAVVHCGWRGTVARLASKALGQLSRRASCDPSAVNAYIGPYIHAECFAVGPDVAQRFSSEFGEDVANLTAAGDGDEAQWRVDLGAAVRADLRDAGADRARIADVGLCTVCNSDAFFSYRAEGGVTGRHGAYACRI